jgi:hypothetical protein
MPEPTPAIDPSAAPRLSRQVLDRIADRWTILVFLASVDSPSASPSRHGGSTG